MYISIYKNLWINWRGPAQSSSKYCVWSNNIWISIKNFNYNYIKNSFISVYDDTEKSQIIVYNFLSHRTLLLIPDNIMDTTDKLWLSSRGLVHNICFCLHPYPTAILQKDTIVSTQCLSLLQCCSNENMNEKDLLIGISLKWASLIINHENNAEIMFLKSGRHVSI